MIQPADAISVFVCCSVVNNHSVCHPVDPTPVDLINLQWVLLLASANMKCDQNRADTISTLNTQSFVSKADC